MMDNPKAAAGVIEINIADGTGDAASSALNALYITDNNVCGKIFIPLIYQRRADMEARPGGAVFPAYICVNYADVLAGDVHVKSIQLNFID